MKTKKIIATVSEVRFSTSPSASMVRLRFMNASRVAPNAPTAAASDGVAQPAMIDPRTSTIRNTGGMKPRSTMMPSSPMLPGPRSSGSGGPNCGQIRVSSMM